MKCIYKRHKMLLTIDLLYKCRKQPIVGRLKCVNWSHAVDDGLYFTAVISQIISIRVETRFC